MRRIMNGEVPSEAKVAPKKQVVDEDDIKRMIMDGEITPEEVSERSWALQTTQRALIAHRTVPLFLRGLKAIDRRRR